MIFYNVCKSDCFTRFRMLLRQIEPNGSNKMEVFYDPMQDFFVAIVDGLFSLIGSAIENQKQF